MVAVVGHDVLRLCVAAALCDSGVGDAVNR